MATILVVDDEPTVCRMLARLLRSEGHEAWCGGSEALAHLGALRPDLVVLDLMMPGVDGFAVLEAMQQQKPALVPVVAYTALDDPETRQRVQDLGAKELIRKGVSWVELYDHLSRYL